MAYRKIPWKRNFNKIPRAIYNSLVDIESDLVVVAAVKLIKASDFKTTYRHLSFPLNPDEMETILPPIDMGKYSTRNQHGWEVRRRDLPMITKTYYWETPNFGDASTYGYHLHHQDREVYQREFHEPRMYQLNIELLRAAKNPNDPSVYRISIDHQIDQANPLFDHELLFMINLLQENVGAVSIFASDARREDYLGTLHLDWQIFPPGTQADIVSRLLGGRTVPPNEMATVAERVKLFSKLRPRAFLLGKGGLNSYVGAQYAEDLVVFENMRYGNALYIMYDNWEEVSQRSRLELLRGTDSSFDRLVHTEGWEEAFERIMRQEKRRRGLRD